MNKIWKIFQYGYLIIAVVFLIEVILSWSTDKTRAYISLFFFVFITFVFFFKRHFRKKIAKRNQQNS